MADAATLVTDCAGVAFQGGDATPAGGTDSPKAAQTWYLDPASLSICVVIADGDSVFRWFLAEAVGPEQDLSSPRKKSIPSWIVGS
jgi:hypothetical protein